MLLHLRMNTLISDLQNLTKRLLFPCQKSIFRSLWMPEQNGWTLPDDFMLRKRQKATSSHVERTFTEEMERIYIKSKFIVFRAVCSYLMISSKGKCTKTLLPEKRFLLLLSCLWLINILNKTQLLPGICKSLKTTIIRQHELCACKAEKHSS